MKFISGICSARSIFLLLLPLVLVAFIGCGDDDPVAVKKASPNRVLELDGVDGFMSVDIEIHNFATFTLEAMVKVPTYDENLHYISLQYGAYLILGDYGPQKISTWAGGLDPVDAEDGTTQPAVTTDEWHHFAFSYDGVNQYILIDGVVTGIVPTTGTVINDTLAYNTALNIGARYNGTQQYVTGQMDEVRLWNIFRTETQIRDNMNKAISSQVGLVGYWNFDDNTTADKSGFGADGTLEGGAAIVDK